MPMNTMMSMRQVILHTDSEAGGWVAEVPSLPGCYSQGETKEEALKNVQEAIKAWMETAREMNFDVPGDEVEIEVRQVSA